MQKICAKVVLKNLYVEQKANWLEISQDLLGRLEIEPDFLDKVITKMNHRCSTTIPRPNVKVRNGTRKVPLVQRKRTWADPGWKLWLLFFHQPWHCAQRICTSRTDNHAFYKDVLERIRKRVQRVRTDIADDWVLHHNNAPAHTALSIREFLAKKNIPILPHPPYSPDLAPSDFYRFPKLKSKGHHFGTMENIIKL